MKNRITNLYVVFSIVLTLEGVSQESNIPSRLMDDPFLMVREAVATTDSNLNIIKYIHANPERYRQPVREMANDTEDVGRLLLLTDLAFLILDGEEARAIAEKALQKLPEDGSPLVLETRKRLKGQLSKGGKDTKEPIPPPKSQPGTPTPEPTFAEKSPTPAKEPAGTEAGDAEADSNPFPYWIFIIGGVVLAGLVVLLRRK